VACSDSQSWRRRPQALTLYGVALLGVSLLCVAGAGWARADPAAAEAEGRPVHVLGAGRRRLLVWDTVQLSLLPLHLGMGRHGGSLGRAAAELVRTMDINATLLATDWDSPTSLLILWQPGPSRHHAVSGGAPDAGGCTWRWRTLLHGTKLLFGFVGHGLALALAAAVALVAASRAGRTAAFSYRMRRAGLRVPRHLTAAAAAAGRLPAWAGLTVVLKLCRALTCSERTAPHSVPAAWDGGWRPPPSPPSAKWPLCLRAESITASHRVESAGWLRVGRHRAAWRVRAGCGGGHRVLGGGRCAGTVAVAGIDYHPRQ
jgi:hypothetical protein